MAMASPMPMPLYQWSTSVSIPMIDAHLIGVFSAIFTVLLCSSVYNIRHYKKEKVNPASGCLPIILQMPIFFVLWSHSGKPVYPFVLQFTST
jgi:hypothetical protein